MSAYSNDFAAISSAWRSMEEAPPEPGPYLTWWRMGVQAEISHFDGEKWFFLRNPDAPRTYWAPIPPLPGAGARRPPADPAGAQAAV